MSPGVFPELPKDGVSRNALSSLAPVCATGGPTHGCALSRPLTARCGLDELLLFTCRKGDIHLVCVSSNNLRNDIVLRIFPVSTEGLHTSARASLQASASQINPLRVVSSSTLKLRQNRCSLDTVHRKLRTMYLIDGLMDAKLPRNSLIVLTAVRSR
jgi:hypothetical protein